MSDNPQSTESTVHTRPSPNGHGRFLIAAPVSVHCSTGPPFGRPASTPIQRGSCS